MKPRFFKPSDDKTPEMELTDFKKSTSEIQKIECVLDEIKKMIVQYKDWINQLHGLNPQAEKYEDLKLTSNSMMIKFKNRLDLLVNMEKSLTDKLTSSNEERETFVRSLNKRGL